ncbi:MAG TPA: hypothetical protein QGG59_10640 [Planctomycetota bacterium]|jgi:DNA-binding response OmpR family regulator|nr:hypothetical protein [Planctomycetota bacterium]MDP6128371.1 hypothetical protein [Planctomycetota bacterium]MDP7245405.1 hypothetical protein [Planctomycetota bacterium]MDP7559462.1 hypothetical protein [Planctomycetota bacterium]HJM40557.1 hypothetical protein [Planctomycetota bacterium]|tara:strand:+ start:28613 stop:28996 length:384 start_codon:yes stop_codon:yes gene_type:complete
MTPRVLVLDNDSSLRDLLTLALGRVDCEAVPCAHAAAAEEMLPSVDFLLLDLNLSEGNSGEQLALRWQEMSILPPFLLVTGAPDDARIQCLESIPSFRGVVSKPFSILELVEQVRTLALGDEIETES